MWARVGALVGVGAGECRDAGLVLRMGCVWPRRFKCEIDAVLERLVGFGKVVSSDGVAGNEGMVFVVGVELACLLVYACCDCVDVMLHAVGLQITHILHIRHQSLTLGRIKRESRENLRGSD